ncbi:hypothetical protein IAT40_000726 [Kwoniella sp. CBS 6097]
MDFNFTPKQDEQDQNQEAPTFGGPYQNQASRLADTPTSSSTAVSIARPRTSPPAKTVPLSRCEPSLFADAIETYPFEKIDFATVLMRAIQTPLPVEFQSSNPNPPLIGAPELDLWTTIPDIAPEMAEGSQEKWQADTDPESLDLVDRW